MTLDERILNVTAQIDRALYDVPLEERLPFLAALAAAIDKRERASQPPKPRTQRELDRR